MPSKSEFYRLLALFRQNGPQPETAGEEYFPTIHDGSKDHVKTIVYRATAVELAPTIRVDRPRRSRPRRTIYSVSGVFLKPKANQLPLAACGVDPDAHAID
jgi:hypothetical protein